MPLDLSGPLWVAARSKKSGSPDLMKSKRNMMRPESGQDVPTKGTIAGFAINPANIDAGKWKNGR